MKESKWFLIDEGEKEFSSKKKAGILKRAWEKSIEKWNLIVKGYLPGSDVYTCGLCDLFYWDYCVECPVYKHTELIDCGGTPYEKWNRRNNIESAKEELKFLKRIQKESMKTKNKERK